MPMNNKITQPKAKNQGLQPARTPATALHRHRVQQPQQHSTQRPSVKAPAQPYISLGDISDRCSEIYGTPNDRKLLDQAFLNDEQIARNHYRTSISRMSGVYAPSTELKKWCDKYQHQFNPQCFKR